MSGNSDKTVAAKSVDEENLNLGARLYADVVRYAEMGDHRTGSDVDLQTSSWLRDELQAVGIEAAFETWPLRQFHVEACWVGIYGQRIEAFPLWFPKAMETGPQVARLVLTEEGDEVAVTGSIALVRFDDNMVTRASCHARIINELTQAGAQAIIGCSPHPSGEIYGQNVIPPYNQVPWPIPVAMIAPRHWHILEQAARRRYEVAFQLSGHDNPASYARNVIGRLARGPRWIVISTPQSGWFRCGGERGAGIALFLKLAGWAANSKQDNSFLFLSNSGHEIGHMGIHHLFEDVALPRPEVTDCWVHLGASIASLHWEDKDGVLIPDGPERDSWLFGSQDIQALLAKGFRELEHLTPEIYNRKHGEIRWILERGYSAFSLMGPHKFFHLKSDGPEGVCPNLLEQIAKALIGTLSNVSEARPSSLPDPEQGTPLHHSTGTPV